MKIALLNDTHAGVRNNNQIFAEYQGRFYTEIFFPYLKKHDIKHIIHLGDYFDRRRDVNFFSLHKNYEHFVSVLEREGITMDLIVGNHDIYFKSTNDLNSPDYLLNFDFINVYKDPTIKNYDSLREELNNFVNSILKIENPILDKLIISCFSLFSIAIIILLLKEKDLDQSLPSSDYF